MKKVVGLFALFCMHIPALIAQNNHPSVQTKIENGILEGFRDSLSGLDIYLGIPYAKPPVDDLRWKAPEEPEDWSGILETKAFGPSAIQTNVWGDMKYRSDGMSEDCLYLNVWAPKTSNSAGLPVLVYFYGGGFVAGDGSEPRYDGASMALKDIVVLTVNYRLNIFGFFTHPELSEEATYKASGNYGLLDQNAALKWVQRNIAAFGGDPERVTIAGESAGSVSVSSHMASPLSKDLINGAIGESGAAINPTLSPIPLIEGEEIGKQFADSAGWKTLEELKALSTNEIFDAYLKSERFGFPSVLDGYFYPKSLPEIFSAGEQAQIPLLLGWNSAEIEGQAFMHGLPYTEENYIKRVKEAFPDNFLLVLKLYPSGSVEEIELSATALASDQFIAYSTWKWFDLHHNNCSRAVYRYLYCKPRPPLVEKTAEEGFSIPEPLGASHACEIGYCLGNLHLIKEFAWTEDDHKVSETFQNYFANFIKTGNPNGEELPNWPLTKSSDTKHWVMLIDVESKAVDARNEDRYQFLDNIYNPK